MEDLKQLAALMMEDLEDINLTELRTMAFKASGVRPHELMSRHRLVEVILTQDMEEDEISPIQLMQDRILDYFDNHPYVLTSQAPCNCRGTMCPSVKVVFENQEWEKIIGTIEEG